MKYKKYQYFVHYHYSDKDNRRGEGHCIGVWNAPLSQGSNLKNFVEKIEEAQGVDTIIVTNFKLLRKSRKK